MEIPLFYGPCMEVENYRNAFAGGILTILKMHLRNVIQYRCSAVFGGVYCLKRNTQSIVISNDGMAT